MTPACLLSDQSNNDLYQRYSLPMLPLDSIVNDKLEYSGFLLGKYSTLLLWYGNILSMPNATSDST